MEENLREPELTKEQAVEIGRDLEALRLKYQAKFPALTIAGWTEQVGSTGFRWLRAEKGELNIPQPGEGRIEDSAEYKAMFDGHGLREQAPLRTKILQCLYIGCCINRFGLAVTATNTIMQHIAESKERSNEIRPQNAASHVQKRSA